MQDLTPFRNLLDWKLLQGSHQWPGHEGGTCINEMAHVMAGYEYRPVCGQFEIPEHISRPIGIVAMLINDGPSDRHRQNLKKHVLAIAHSADRPEVEARRVAAFFTGVIQYLWDRQAHRLVNYATALCQHMQKLFSKTRYSTTDAYAFPLVDSETAVSIDCVSTRGWHDRDGTEFITVLQRLHQEVSAHLRGEAVMDAFTLGLEAMLAVGKQSDLAPQAADRLAAEWMHHRAVERPKVPSEKLSKEELLKLCENVKLDFAGVI